MGICKAHQKLEAEKSKLKVFNEFLAKSWGSFSGLIRIEIYQLTARLHLNDVGLLALFYWGVSLHPPTTMEKKNIELHTFLIFLI